MFPRYILIAFMLVLAACSGTRQAYRQAEGVEQTAKVVVEHYYKLVSEISALDDRGVLTDTDLQRLQNLVQASWPTIRALANTAQQYKAFASAENEAALNRAITDAALALSDLIDALKALGGFSAIVEYDNNTLLSAFKE